MIPPDPRLVDCPYVIVNIRCQLCPSRRGRYRLARLAAKHGPNILLDDLLARIAAGCPRRGSRGNQYVPKCHAWFDDLSSGRKPDLPEPPAEVHVPPAIREMRYVIYLRDRSGESVLCELARFIDVNDARALLAAIEPRYVSEPITLQEGMHVLAATRLLPMRIA